MLAGQRSYIALGGARRQASPRFAQQLYRTLLLQRAAGKLLGDHFRPLYRRRDSALLPDVPVTRTIYARQAGQKSYWLDCPNRDSHLSKVKKLPNFMNSSG
jgi:hypothetical protein